MMYFRLETCFRPYVRMTRGGKWVKPEAQEYLSSQRNLANEFKRQMDAEGFTMISRGVPIEVMRLAIYHAHGFHNRDLDNEIKAVLDAAQGVVFEDDRWIDEISAWRERRDKCAIMLYLSDGRDEDD